MLLLALVWILNFNILFTQRILPANESILTTDSFPDDERLRATVGNGYVAHVISSDTIYISGVFNGETQSQGSNPVSHRARIPATNSLNFSTNLDGSFSNYALDVQNGYFSQTWKSNDGSASVTQFIYAHQKYRNLLMTEFDVNNSNNGNELSISIWNSMGSISSDDMSFDLVNCDYGENNLCYTGTTNIAEQTQNPVTLYIMTSTMSNDKNSPTVTTVDANSNLKLYYPIVLITSLEYNINNLSLTAYQLYKTYLDESSNLLNLQIESWNNLWLNGRIDVSSDSSQIAMNTYSSLYYIYSSIRSDWYHGLSPGGLSSDAYNGHTFWDQSTWMYPPLLMLQLELAYSAMEYRINLTSGALLNAQLTSYKGARFPWESASSGLEVCPPSADTGTYEVHITGDIAFALRQYYYITGDNNYLLHINYTIQEICNFWLSRSEYDSDNDQYVINDVIPPDEYAKGDNSVYTNYVAQQSLSFCIEILNKYNNNIPSIYYDYVNKIKIPYDSTNKYHPEYDGYVMGTEVKQADVILLGFPLMMNMSSIVRANDLNIYEAVTDPNGPAMTWAMFSIGYIELGNYSKADELFSLDYANIRKPYGIWTETADGGGAVNFITGAGGYLQSLIFGYGGIRIFKDYLYINSKHLFSNGLNLIGINYRGNKLNINFDNTNENNYITITITKSYDNSQLLQVITSNNDIIPLTNSTNAVFTKIQQPLLIQIV